MQIGFLRLGVDDVPFFLGSLGIAMAIVFLFSRQRFGVSTMEKKPEDFVAQLLPRHLATREEYAYGLHIYMAAMILSLLALSFLGKPILDFTPLKFEDGKEAAVAVPIIAALALVGLLKADVPYLKEIEWQIRYFAHQHAYIPASALATTETLTAAEFDFSRYRDPEILAQMEGVEAADFDRRRDSILYEWARLNCLLYALRGGYESYLDGELLRHYEHDLGKIFDRLQELAARVVEFRSQKREHPHLTDEPLRRTLKTSLWQLYVLIGCAVRLRAGTQGHETWRRFGFVLRPAVARPENRDVMLVGLTVMTFSVFATVFVAFGLGQAELWQPSKTFPAKAYEALIWAVSTGLVHGAAVLVSNTIRGRLDAKNRWFSTRGSMRVANYANYVRVGIGCGVVAYGVLFLWGLLFQSPTWGMAVGMMPYALLPATTGAFYACHLDNVELRNRPPRRWEVALQALTTACVAFVAVGAWLSLGNLPWGANVDYLLLVTAIGAVIGGSLGWYIPEAVSQSRYDPLDEAKKERVLSLEAMAAEQFDSFDKAQAWLSTPLALLQNMAPSAAAATIEGYQEAVALLHRRPAAL